MTTRADDFEQRALIARAAMGALVITTGLGLAPRVRAEQPPTTARRGCAVCGDPTGVRCCEFGAAV